MIVFKHFIFCVPAALFFACTVCFGQEKMPFETAVSPDAEWTLTVESLSDPDKVQTFSREEARLVSVREDRDGKTFRFTNVGGMGIEVTLRYARNAYDGGLDLKISVKNRAKGWVVSDFTGPELKGLSDNSAKGYSLLTSTRKGLRTSLEALKAEPAGRKKIELWTRSEDGSFFSCPAYGPMKYCIFEGPGEGVYAAIENERYEYVGGQARYYPAEDQIGIRNRFLFFCRPGETYETPVTHLWRYKGDWHTAAERYREWFLAHHEIAAHPEWLRHTTGWMLTILKQQNAEVIWPYESIGREMSDIAEANGMNLVGLFGRAVGGHDRYYPNYASDPAMGGEEALREGLKELHARGLRAIVYVNGQLLDRDSGNGWWESTGKRISLVNKKGEVYGESFQKFHDGPNRQFTFACMRSKQWQDMLLGFAMDAAELGADGIIFDQQGSPHYRRCYSPDHGHPVPAYSYGPDLLETLEHVYNEVHKKYPDFVLMTEGYCDYELPSVGISHRGLSGKVYTITQERVEAMARQGGVCCPFPQLFLYTFPETVTTTDNPAPLCTRLSVNYAAMFNERPEIEVRYAPDKAFLQTGINRTQEEYRNIKGPASGSGPYHEKMVMEGDLAASTAYTRAVLKMLKDHSDVLYDGRFTDEGGFTLKSESPLVYAKSYTSGDRLAVLVWNISDTSPATYEVLPEKGYRLESLEAPEGIPSPEAPLAPESLHLLIFKNSK